MTILIVDGYYIMRKTMIRYLELGRNFDQVLEAGSVQSAKMIIKKEKIDVLLFDIQLPDSSGLDLVRYCQSQLRKPIIILCSNYGMRHYTNTYSYLSINYYFDKSSELTGLKKLIQNIANDYKTNSGGFKFKNKPENKGGYYETN